MSEEKSNNGVNIPIREIYDIVQEIRNEVRGIGPKLTQIEKDAAKGVEAHAMATEALKLATKHAEGFKWVWRTAGTALIMAVVGFIFLAIQLGITSQIQKSIETPTNIEIRGGK